MIWVRRLVGAYMIAMILNTAWLAYSGLGFRGAFFILGIALGGYLLGETRQLALMRQNLEETREMNKETLAREQRMVELLQEIMAEDDERRLRVDAIIESVVAENLDLLKALAPGDMDGASDYVLHNQSCNDDCHGGFACPICHEAFGWCVNPDPITDPEQHPPECIHPDISRFRKVFHS